MTNSSASQKILQSWHNRARRSLLVLAVAAGMAATSTQAQVLVHDTGTIGAVEKGSESQLAQQLKGYAQDYEQLKNMVARYQAMLTKIQSLGSGISLAPKSLEPMSDDEADKLVDGACPGASAAGLLGTALSAYQSTEGKTLSESQQVICVAIARVEIDEYNVTAKALAQLTLQQSTMQKLSEIVNGISSEGESSSAQSQAQQFSAQLQVATATWKTQIEADEAMVRALQAHQASLAKIALNGDNNVPGKLIQAGAFAAAFKLNP